MAETVFEKLDAAIISIEKVKKLLDEILKDNQTKFLSTLPLFTMMACGCDWLIESLRTIRFSLSG